MYTKENVILKNIIVLKNNYMIIGWNVRLMISCRYKYVYDRERMILEETQAQKRVISVTK